VGHAQRPPATERQDKNGTGNVEVVKAQNFLGFGENIKLDSSANTHYEKHKYTVVWSLSIGKIKKFSLFFQIFIDRVSGVWYLS
jgi:hypothetical protein